MNKSDVSILKEIMDVVKKLPPDPIVEYMKKEGFDPDQGCILMWPGKIPGFWGEYGPPRYIKVSNHITEPHMINSSNLLPGLFSD